MLGYQKGWRQSRAWQRGFTLFETLIVLAIGVAVIGGIMFVMQANERSERRDNATRVQAQEMATIAKAARQWADTTGEDWTDGSRNVVTIDDLVDNGLLPDDFAARDPDPLVMGVTPTGQRYTIVSVKNGPSGSLYHDPTVDEGKIRTVIWDEGTPVAGRLERVGVQNVAGAITAWKEAVSLYASNEYSIPMGVLVVGSGEVRGVGRSFTKDVIDWIENEVSQPAAVALVGFPDLEGDGGPTEPTGPVGSQGCEDVQIIEEGAGCPYATNPGQCSVSYDEPMCPSGYEELAATYICEDNNIGSPVVAMAGSTGTFVLGREVESITTPSVAVPYTLANGQSGLVNCGSTTTESVTGYVKLSGSTVWQAECSYSSNGTRVVYYSSYFPPSCEPTTATFRQYRTFLQVPEARTKVCCRRPASG